MNHATEDVSREAVVVQLDRLCASATFRNSARLCRFLRYTIEVALRGEGGTLKEYVIGTEVYDRRPPYHPSQDSIVRTEAKRLRNKLKEYYETEGAEDDVLIYYRTGKYEPVFRSSVQLPEPPKVLATLTAAPGAEIGGFSIAVLPFRHDEGDPEAAAIAAGITDDLMFRIGSTEGCRLVASQSVATVQPHIADVSLLSHLVSIDQVITGSVRRSAAHVRVSVIGVHPSGLETWSERFDFTTNDDDRLMLEDQTAWAILDRIAAQDPRLRTTEVHAPEICLSTFGEMLSAEATVDEATSRSLRSALAQLKNLATGVPESSRVQCAISLCYYSLSLLREDLGSGREAKGREEGRTNGSGDGRGPCRGGASPYVGAHSKGSGRSFSSSVSVKDEPDERTAVC